jgi:transcriptional regulator with XRE-family HTH domain
MTPDPTDERVGSRVRMGRLMLGMTQQELGAALGLTVQQVEDYEGGTAHIGASRLMHVAQVLKVTPTFFFENNEPTAIDRAKA